MFGTISLTVGLGELTYSQITYVTGLLISVSGILLGLSGLSPLSRSVERMKLQVALAITTLLWLLAVEFEAQTVIFNNVTWPLRFFFLTGIGLFTLLAVTFSVSTVEATKQRLLAEQAAKAVEAEKTTS